MCQEPTAAEYWSSEEADALIASERFATHHLSGQEPTAAPDCWSEKGDTEYEVGFEFFLCEAESMRMRLAGRRLVWFFVGWRGLLPTDSHALVSRFYAQDMDATWTDTKNQAGFYLRLEYVCMCIFIYKYVHPYIRQDDADGNAARWEADDSFELQRSSVGES